VIIRSVPYVYFAVRRSRQPRILTDRIVRAVDETFNSTFHSQSDPSHFGTDACIKVRNQAAFRTLFNTMRQFCLQLLCVSDYLKCSC